VIFRELELWFDPVARSGPEAMAVDQWLLETRDLPVMRVYDWKGKWGSVGYFGSLSEAKVSFPDVQWVRRWTGGGIVDHRSDWTYSLMIPRKFEVARMKGGESYRAIHQVLASVIEDEGENAPQLAGDSKSAGGVCFESPVEFDVIGGVGEKLAGAAQRRSKAGLLHQGSVAIAGSSRLRAGLFAERLAESWFESEVFPDQEQLDRLVESRYGAASWLNRR
jgi:lipoate-protein ligase A